MNCNILAYIIFLALMVFIIRYVGRYFYTRGRIFILFLLNGQDALADRLNRLLLLAYYLFNIGYAFLKLRSWPPVANLPVLLSSLASNMGLLILILACTHYFNMLSIYLLSKTKTNFFTHKSMHHE